EAWVRVQPMSTEQARINWPTRIPGSFPRMRREGIGIFVLPHWLSACGSKLTLWPGGRRQILRFAQDDNLPNGASSRRESVASPELRGEPARAEDEAAGQGDEDDRLDQQAD